MRPTSAATRAFTSALRAPATRYTCAACRTFTSSSRDAAVIDAVRKKIWGTDQPPGAKDPYKQDSMSQYQKTKEPAKKPAASAAPADMSTYQPADNAEGLEEVGGKGIWWMNRVEPEFEGFIPSMKLEDPYEVTAALHRAVVEVFALRAAELPLSTLGAAGITPDMTSEVQIVAAQDGARLGLPDHIKLEELTATLRPARDEVSVKTNPSPAEAEVAADRTEVDPIMATKVKGAVDETITKGNPSPAEAEVAADRSGNDPLKDATFMQMVEHWDPVWLSVSLKEPEVKFALVKRIMQLTGYRLSDADINNAKTVADILGHLATPPKARRLIEALAQKQSLFELPNVKVYGRRVTPVDKEREVGRWKVIEEELSKRGLPVTGHEQ